MTAPDHDWLAETRGLAYMILTIKERYDLAQLTGGDNELLRSAIYSAHAYVDGPLREMVGPQ